MRQLYSVLGRITKQFPDSKTLALLLNLLHFSERPSDGSGSGDGENAVAQFCERKTQVYNTLIRISNVCDNNEAVFVIIDEMDKRGIDKDMETLEVLSEQFCWQGMVG